MSVRRSISIIFVAKYLEHGLALLSGIVLARLLTPEDFGIYSIAASVVMLGYQFRNFGVGQYLVQAKEVTEEMMRSAFTVTLVVSWAIGLLLMVFAPALGSAYEEGGVTEVLYLLSLNFFLLPFGSVTNALLRRNMQFEKLAVINVCAAVTSLIVGVSAAFWGASYLSIAWASNASTLVSILVTLFYRFKNTPWLPGFSRLREVASFGIKVGVVDLSNRGADAATELSIGQVHSLHDLGIYSRAYGTFRLFEFAFIQTIRPVVLPYLSQAQHGKEDMAATYLRIISLTTILTLPFFTFLAFNAEQVIGLLYGDQWGSAVPILQVMCVAGLFYAPTLFFEQLLIASGRPGQAMRFVVVSQFLRLLALALLITISLQAAACALIAGYMVRFVTLLRMAKHYFQLSPIRLLAVLRPAIATTLFLAAMMWGLHQALPMNWNVFYVLLVAGPLFVVTWLMAILVLRHPIRDELNNVVKTVKSKL